jgi:hypothetical protein
MTLTPVDALRDALVEALPILEQRRSDALALATAAEAALDHADDLLLAAKALTAQLSTAVQAPDRVTP